MTVTFGLSGPTDNRDADRDRDFVGDRYRNRNFDVIVNFHADSDGECYRDGDSYSHRHLLDDANRDTYSYLNRHSYSDCYRHNDGDRNLERHAYIDTYDDT